MISGTYHITNPLYIAWGEDWFTAEYDEDTNVWTVLDSVGRAAAAGWVRGVVKENMHNIWRQFTYTLTIPVSQGLWVEEIEP